MQIQFVAKGIDLSEALRARVTERIAESVDKYFHRPGEAVVTVTRDGAMFRLKCSLHLPSGVAFQAVGEHADAYGAAEEAMARLDKRLRRYKTRLKDRGPGMKSAPPPEELPVRILEGRGGGSDADTGEPVIIAETTRELPVMPVGAAVLEMEYSDAPFLLFRNAAHDVVNIVYRRPDGNIGWLDLKRSAEPSG